MIARTLNVPYVAIVDGDTEASVAGVRPSDRELADVPLTYQGAEIGHLYVASRRAGTTLSNRDLDLLADLGQQLGVALYAIRASDQVQESRAALVTAREEERRRIRRDLHDGLGPTLASMKLQLTAVARLLDTEPGRAAHLLTEVRDAMDETTADIRRLVYGLRPPLIDELGPDRRAAQPLLGPLGRRGHGRAGRAARAAGRGRGGALPDRVGGDPQRGSPFRRPAVPRSASRSAPTTCACAISDDGRGLPEPLVEGVGLSAIRERAAELGGTVELTNDGGTTITTVVPLRSSATP